jgi:hypothetical protein
MIFHLGVLLLSLRVTMQHFQCCLLQFDAEPVY